MYTLEQLQQKTLKELKEIGHQLNVLPEVDRRCRQNWIDAIVGVNPPLLQLLEFSLAASVEQVHEPIEVQSQVRLIESKFGRIVYPRLAQKPIAQAVENSSDVEVDRVSEVIKLGDWVKVNRKPRLASGVKRGEIFQVLRVNPNGVLVIENPHENPKYILSARLGFLDPSEVCLVPRSNRLDTPAFIDVVFRNFPDRLQELLQNPPGVDCVQKPIEVQAQEPIIETVENSPCVDRPPLRKLYPAYKLVRLPEGCLGYKGWIRTLSLAQLKKFAAERNIFLDSDSPQDWIEAIFCWFDCGDYGPRLVDSEGFELGFLPPSVDDFRGRQAPPKLDRLGFSRNLPVTKISAY
jgi:hypothetical protein